MSNGILYAIGGQAGNARFSAVEAYDPATDSWRKLAPLPESYGRVALAAVALDGLIYAIGGFEVYEESDTVDAYDPATDRWKSGRRMPTKRQSLAAVILNGLVYAVGGACYDDTLSVMEAFVP